MRRFKNEYNIKSVRGSVTVLFIMLMVLASGCGTDGRNEDSREKIDFAKIKAEKGEKLLVHHFDEKIIRYDETKKSMVAEYRVNQNNVYSFMENDDFFTAGDSVRFGFGLYKRLKDRIETIYLADESRGLFPLFSRGDSLFMTEKKYHKDRVVESLVLEYNIKTKKIKRYPQIEGNVMYADILGDKIYYSTYSEEQENYNIYKFNLSSNKSIKIAAEKYGEIYRIGDKIYLGDGKKILPMDKTGREYEYSDSLFCVKDRCLLQYFISDEKDLKLKLIDIKTGRTKDVVDDAISFEVDGNLIKVYTEGNIKKYECD